MKRPSICLIVPMYGDADYFERCIESMSKLTYEPLEIILVDDGMTPPALRKVERFAPRVRVLKSNGKGPAYARNYAAQQTKADLLAFTDSDCIVSPDWLQQLCEGLGADPEIAGCGGGQVSPEDSTPFQQHVMFFLQRMGMVAEYVRRPGEEGIGEVNHNASCNVIYRRQAFVEVGGFPDAIFPGEDVVLDRRLTDAGYKLRHKPTATVRHFRPTAYNSFRRWMWRYGLAQGWLVRHYGVFRKVHYVGIAASLMAALVALTAIFRVGDVASALLVGILAMWAWLRFNVTLLCMLGVAGSAWLTGFVWGVMRPRRFN